MIEGKRYNISGWGNYIIAGGQVKIKSNTVIAIEGYEETAILSVEKMSYYRFNDRHMSLWADHHGYHVPNTFYVSSRIVACKFERIYLCDVEEQEMPIFDSYELAEADMALRWFTKAIDLYGSAKGLDRYWIGRHLRKFVKKYTGTINAALHEKILLTKNTFL